MINQRKINQITNFYSSNWQLVCEACCKNILKGNWDIHNTADQDITCVSKSKKQIAKKDSIRVISTPPPTMTPSPGSPLPSEQYWVCHTCSQLFSSKLSYKKHMIKKEKKHSFLCVEPWCANVMTSKLFYQWPSG